MPNTLIKYIGILHKEEAEVPIALLFPKISYPSHWFANPGHFLQARLPASLSLTSGYDQ